MAAVACLALALLWGFRALAARDVVGAVGAAALCLGVLALDLVAAAVLRLGGLILRCAQRLDAIEDRVAALEVSTDALEQALGQPVDLTEVGSGDAAPLVAARVERHVFPRLVRPAVEPAGPDAGLPTTPPAVGSTITGQRELDQLVRKEMERLRTEFAEMVRQEDFAGALHAGERIRTLFPDSALAEQFESIRQHLTRRASEQEPRQPASAV